MKQKACTAAGAALALALSLALLSGCLWLCGTGAPLMTRWMLACAPGAYTTLPEDAYAPLCRMLTGYLRGGVPEFQYTLTSAAGDAVPLFHSYEQAHMADCRALFALDRQVLTVSLVLSAALFLFAARSGRRRPVWKGVAWGSAGFLLLALLLLLWGLVNFHGLFVTFHRVAFTNDLWLLNPQTDLLVRLMPTALFIRYAALIGAVWGGGTLALLLTALMKLRRTHKA